LEELMAAVGGGVKGLLARASREARRRSQEPTTAHLLLAMLRAPGTCSELLGRSGLNEVRLLGALARVPHESAGALTRAAESAGRDARTRRPGDEAGVHLLVAILRDARSAAHRALSDAGISPERVQDAALALVGESATAPKRRPIAAASFRMTHKPQAARPPAHRPAARRLPTVARKSVPPPSPVPSVEPPGPVQESAAPATRAPTPAPQVSAVAPEQGFWLDPERFPFLAARGEDLTARALRGELDPVIGRDAEVDAVLDVFSRRRANNPVLVGAPGVGKTAVAEAVAQRLADGGVGVAGLNGAHLVELTAGALVSGTGVRGALSERMKKLRAEVALADGKILLFIDELHAVVGGGEGPDDLAHELKASLARGELPVLGATTEDEYDKYIARDPALARRFSPVHVEEPSQEVALAILKGLAPRYERYHCTAFHPAALRAAVELSARYMPERHLPDKAVATLDLAAARVRRRGGDVVDAAAVASVVAERSRVPVERLLRDDSDRLIELEETLATRIVGHDAILGRVSDALRKGAAGFHGARPLATFLFLGPTGVGKTETAKAIADTFFPGSGMTRVDMSELSESHAVSRLLGAPPGYVGHDRGGLLTEAVRRRPYQLLLLDEMEKAHPEVLLALLPLLDEGRMTDGRGRTVDFRNTVIVMTSNLGVPRRAAPIGFGGASSSAPSSDDVIAAARRALPPELYNRIDEPLVFGPLTRDDVAEIARRMLHGVGLTLEREHDIPLVVEESAIDALIEAGDFDPALGERPMRRVVGRLVEAALARGLLAGEHRRGEPLVVRGRGAEIRLEPFQADAAE